MKCKMKCKSEREIKRFLFSIKNKEMRIVIADTYYYTNKGFIKIYNECSNRFNNYCLELKKDCSFYLCPQREQLLNEFLESKGK